MAKKTDDELEQGRSADMVDEREQPGSYEDAYRPNSVNVQGGSTGGQPEAAAGAAGGTPAKVDADAREPVDPPASTPKTRK